MSEERAGTPMATNYDYAAYIETSLGTHFATNLSDSMIVADFKKKILEDHKQCFPAIGDLKMKSIEVTRKGKVYRLADSMIVKTAFQDKSCCFMTVDICKVEPCDGLANGIDSSVHQPKGLVSGVARVQSSAAVQVNEKLLSQDVDMSNKNPVIVESQHDLSKLVPSPDAGLCESDVDGSFLHENRNRDLRLFSDGEDGGQYLLQFFIERAEAELQANFGENVAINSLKVEISHLFGAHVVKPTSSAKYKGDWMKRPASGDEIAWLANLLVRLSSWLNESLGLNQTQSNEMIPKWSSYLDVPYDVVRNADGYVDTLRVVLCVYGSWLLMVAGEVIGKMNKHNLRVNLRVLASKKILMILMVLLVAALFSIVKKAFGLSHGV